MVNFKLYNETQVQIIAKLVDFHAIDRADVADMPRGIENLRALVARGIVGNEPGEDFYDLEQSAYEYFMPADYLAAEKKFNEERHLAMSELVRLSDDQAAENTPAAPIIQRQPNGAVMFGQLIRNGEPHSYIHAITYAEDLARAENADYDKVYSTPAAPIKPLVSEYAALTLCASYFYELAETTTGIAADNWESMAKEFDCKACASGKGDFIGVGAQNEYTRLYTEYRDQRKKFADVFTLSAILASVGFSFATLTAPVDPADDPAADSPEIETRPYRLNQLVTIQHNREGYTARGWISRIHETTPSGRFYRLYVSYEGIGVRLGNFMLKGIAIPMFNGAPVNDDITITEVI